MVSMQDVIGPELVTVDLDATDARGAVEELTKLLEADGRVSDVSGYVDAVMAREDETGGTGMESGVAIPHGKSGGVERTGIAFGRSSTGVDFGAEDGTPSDLIFLIAAPEGEDDLHVTLLSKLARKLIHEDFREALREADSPQAVVNTIDQEVEL